MKYGRLMRLVVGPPGERGEVLSSVQPSGAPGLHLSATIRRSLGEAPTIECRAWGVSDSTLSILQTPGAATRIEAGYGGSATAIAAGLIIPGTLDEQRDGKLWAPVWRVSDGDVMLSRASVSRAWDDTDSGEVLDYLIGLSGLTRGTVSPGGVVRYPTGTALVGSVRAALDEVCEDTGSRWEVVAGVLHVWPIGQQLQASRVVLSPDTGLLSAERADGGRWLVRALFEAAIRPGDTVRVDCQRFRGVLRATDVEHALDSGYNATYDTAISGVPV